MNARPSPAQPPKEIRDAIFNRIDRSTLPSLQAQNVFRLANDSRCSSARFAKAIEADENLAPTFLEFANCPANARGATVGSVQQAIVRIGFLKTSNLVLAAAVSRLIKNLPVQQTWAKDLLWHHSIMTASACVRLNRRLGCEFHGEEFVAGLAHDLGRFLLATILDAPVPDVDPMDFRETVSPLPRERQATGTDHCELGAWFAEELHLPIEVVSAIRQHHDPWAPGAEPTLKALVATADHLSNHLTLNQSPEGYDEQQNPGMLALKTGVMNQGENTWVNQESILDAVYQDGKRTACGNETSSDHACRD